MATNVSILTDYSSEYSSILSFSTIGVVLLSVIVVILPFSLKYYTKTEVTKMLKSADMEKDSYKIFAIFFLDTISRQTLIVIIIAILYAFTSVSSLIGFIFKESFEINIFTKGICLVSSVIYALLLTVVTVYSCFKSKAIRDGFEWLQKVEPVKVEKPVKAEKPVIKKK